MKPVRILLVAVLMSVALGVLGPLEAKNVSESAGKHGKKAGHFKAHVKRAQETKQKSAELARRRAEAAKRLAHIKEKLAKGDKPKLQSGTVKGDGKNAAKLKHHLVNKAPGVDKRQKIQRRRIVRGIAGGALTKKEADRLKAAEKRIAGLEKTFKADGKLTHRERGKLHLELNLLSRQIFIQKHDAQARKKPKYPVLKILKKKDLTGAEAKAAAKDLRRMSEIRRILAHNKKLTGEEREKLKDEFEALHSELFEE